MKRPRAWWIVIFICAAAIGLSSFWLPAPLDVNAPQNAFSAGRAFQHIRAIAKTPHPTGSPENARVREYLLQQMRDLSLNPREMNGAPNGTAVVNLYGELEGTEKRTPQILLMAHYDSVPMGPGAADDSTGVAVVLESIRALKSRGPLRNTIGILLTDGEEVHGVCLGAHLFVTTQTNLLRDLHLIVNLEARGNHGPALMFQTGRDNNGLIRLFAGACPLPVAASFSEDVYRRMPNDTDLTEFLNVGKRGYNFAFTAGIEFYHSSNDTPDNVDQLTVQHYGECVLPLISKLGAAGDERLQACLKPGDATFFTLFRGAFVHYPASVARMLVVATAVFFVAVVIREFRRQRISLKRAVAGFGATVASMILAASLGFGFVYALTRIFKPRVFGPFIVGVPASELFLLSLIVVAAAVVLLLRGKLMKRFSSSENLAGSVAIWLTLAIATNSLLPGASYLFQWPAFFATVGIVLQRRFEIALTAAPSALLLAPTTLLLHQTITIGIAPVSVMLLALAISLCPVHSNAPTS